MTALIQNLQKFRGLSFALKQQPWGTVSCNVMGKNTIVLISFFFFFFSGTVNVEKVKAICQVQITL